MISSITLVVLMLVSSITTTVIGRTVFSNSTICWGSPSSKMVKSSRSRSGTRRPSRSVTVTYRSTSSVPLRNSGSWLFSEPA